MTVNNMQKRILERLEHDVASFFGDDVPGKPGKPDDKYRLWTTWDPTVASNVGIVSVGRYSDVAASVQVRADFQAEAATFKTIDGSPTMRGINSRTAMIRLAYGEAQEQQHDRWDALVQYLTEAIAAERA